MIYLIDSNTHKVIFDKENQLQAYAVGSVGQKELRNCAHLLIGGSAEIANKTITVYPFKSIEKRLDGKVCFAFDAEDKISLKLEQILWKVIHDEKQEEDLKYIEIL